MSRRAHNLIVKATTSRTASDCLIGGYDLAIDTLIEIIDFKDTDARTREALMLAREALLGGLYALHRIMDDARTDADADAEGGAA